MIVFIKTGTQTGSHAVQETIGSLERLPEVLARIKTLHPSIDRPGAIGLILDDGAEDENKPLHRFDVSTGTIAGTAA